MENIKVNSVQHFNPLVDDLTDIPTKVLEEKLLELNKKYWMTQNPQVRGQMVAILDMYKLELQARRAQDAQKNNDQGDNSLDNLINIS